MHALWLNYNVRPLHIMTTCTYCGRENEEAAHCRECGTDLRPVVPVAARPLSPRTLQALARLGPLILTAVCVLITFDVSDAGRRPIYPLGFILFIVSPLIFGIGLWLLSAWFRAELRQIERVVSGSLLGLSLTFLGLASAFDIFMIAIGGMGPR